MARRFGTNSKDNNLVGTNENDEIWGFGDDDVLYGLDGDDILNGGTGADTMFGGRNNDTYYVDNAGDVVSENVGEGLDTVRSSISYTLGAHVENLTLEQSGGDINGTGNALNNTIIGNGHDNVLTGGGSSTGPFGGNDVLIGNGGNDTLRGDGVDQMFGGADNDTYFVNHWADQVIENAGEGYDIVYASRSYTLTANVEQLSLQGTATSATGNDLDNRIEGTGGDNVLDGRAGADMMFGRFGNDSYYVDDFGDVVFENAGQGVDLVYSSVSYELGANVENLTMLERFAPGAPQPGTGPQQPTQPEIGQFGTGNGLDNVIQGNSENNTIDGRAGGDTMIGGLGNDSYFVDNAAEIGGDAVVENFGEGVDWVYSSTSYRLAANVENLRLLEGNGDISGRGNDLGNEIIGNSGANLISGRGGNDVLTGGADDDVFFYNLGDGKDVVTDFLAGDKSGDLIVLDSRIVEQHDLRSFEDVMNLASQEGSDTVIKFADGNITLQNVELGSLNAGDFNLGTFPEIL